MVRLCETCRRTYDDARALTYCPHDPFMSEADLAQKIAGLQLFGKRVVFAHLPGLRFHVQAVTWNGMVALEGLAGEFAPHLFMVVENQE